ncbi:MAG TPA: SH3 domain-containing protein [Spirochaetota bacterium]|nr:SH3 domain-containing protein [Spirochaetota bacterium]HPF06674.1 SH3 domain-containing protein [Spirochaetota bacterium]HPJ41731.1 SH3 domain-containing protein [Spirochaetota bacterium]HPR36642.1 SH3 domain-containing protein [Spirochaetota bacterium]HRX47707.1 SH3 domain-containing protein [Spirochaetota bacterium]
MKTKITAFVLLLFISPMFLTAEEEGESLTLEKQLYTDFSGSVINSAVVNLREKPDTDSKVIARLNKGDKITVIEQTGAALFVDKYLGVWLKVKSPKGKDGYVLSSFVNAPANKVEHFHLFFDRFKKAWIKKNIKEVSKHTDFPLQYLEAFEGSVESLEIPETDFFKKAVIKEPYMYKMTYEIESGNTILVHYGYEAQQYTLFFMIADGKWRLFKIKISSC